MLEVTRHDRAPPSCSRVERSVYWRAFVGKLPLLSWPNAPLTFCVIAMLGERLNAHGVACARALAKQVEGGSGWPVCRKQLLVT